MLVFSVSEVAGQGHWFDNVVSDDTIQSFLDKYLDPYQNPGLNLPPLPESFTISTLNPASTGSRGSIKILQLEVPYRLATIRVHRVGDGTKWILHTSNVRRFAFYDDVRSQISSWTIDGQKFNDAPKKGPSYLREKLGPNKFQWTLVPDLLWISEERYSSTYGPVSQIFSHPFLIVIPSKPTGNSAVYRMAAQHLTTSWYLYGRGGVQIVKDVDVRDGMSAKYHLIVLGGSKDNYYTRKRENEGDSTNLGM
jgi:hypothetical protein